MSSMLKYRVITNLVDFEIDAMPPTITPTGDLVLTREDGSFLVGVAAGEWLRIEQVDVIDEVGE